MKIHFHNQMSYEPCAPCADNESLAKASPRLMYRHTNTNNEGVEIFVASKGILTAGWVIGIIHNHTLPVS